VPILDSKNAKIKSHIFEDNIHAAERIFYRLKSLRFAPTQTVNFLLVVSVWLADFLRGLKTKKPLFQVAVL
jgi:hypothetical protein